MAKKKKRTTAKLCGYKTLRARNIAIVKYMLETDATCLEAGNHYNISRTTVRMACHYVMMMGSVNRYYAKLGRDIKTLLECHTSRSKFQKSHIHWIDYAKKMKKKRK